MVKDLPTKAGDLREGGSIPVSGRSPGGGHGNPLQYSCLENHHGRRSLAGYSPWGCTELDTPVVTWHTRTKVRKLRRGKGRACRVDEDGAMEWEKVQRGGLRLRMSKAPSSMPTAGPNGG